MGAREEFTKATKRAALERSGGKCEASGPLYGYPFEFRCNAPLSHGVEFDHFILASEGGDASLDNCRAVCPHCHSFKTRKIDTPKAAKIKRVRDKHNGIRPPSRLQGRGFARAEPQHSARRPIVRKSERVE